jgi:hypothetical protein
VGQDRRSADGTGEDDFLDHSRVWNCVWVLVLEGRPSTSSGCSVGGAAVFGSWTPESAVDQELLREAH